MILAVMNAIYAIAYKKPEEVRISTGFEHVSSRYRCGALTNWAMKPLTLEDGHLWVPMSPWGMNVKWYMKSFIYRTADVKSSNLWSSQLWTQFMQLRINTYIEGFCIQFMQFMQSINLQRQKNKACILKNVLNRWRD